MHVPYSGVGRFDGANWQNFGKADGLFYDTVNSITVDKQGRVWTAGKGGLCYYDLETGWHSLTIQDSLSPGREFFSVVCDSSGNIWASSWSLVFNYWVGPTPVYKAYSEISRWDGDSWTTFDFTKEDPSFSGVESRYMTVAPNGTLWAVYIQPQDSLTGYFYGGLRRFDGNHWGIDTLGGTPLRRYRYPTAIACDAQNTVWVGYWDRGVEGGLDKFDGIRWTTDASPRFLAAYVRSMTCDRSGHLWVTGFGESPWHGVIEYDGNTILRNFDSTNSALLGGTLFSVAFDNSGDAWFSSELGISELTGASTVSRLPADEPSSLSAYPNPASNSTMIEYAFMNDLKGRFVIYDALGRTMHEEEVAARSVNMQRFELNTSSLRSGIYVLRLESGNTSVTRKLLIEH
jgi:streptogramin lyase